MTNRKIGNTESGEKAGDDGGALSHGKQWFFGIGISEYAEFPNLDNAVKDVTDLSELLVEDYGFSPEHAVTLFNDQANRENIIDELNVFVRKVGKEDSLLIYFAGHGHLISETQRGFWIPCDAKRNSTSKYLSNSSIRDYLADINSKHTLLIADSCFSGSLFVRGASRSSAALHELESIPSRWAICSGRHDEEVSDGEPGDNSPFAESILDSLRENTKRVFNVSRLVERVVEQTRSNFEQLPEGNPVQSVGHKGGQYMFHRTAREEKFWEECQRNNTIRGYSRYLGQFPEGKYRSEALIQIKETEDEKAWRKAEGSGTVYELHIYVDSYPDGKYVAEAKEMILSKEKRTSSLYIPKRPIVDEKTLPPVDQIPNQEQFQAHDIEGKEDARNKPEVQLGKPSQKEEKLDHQVSETLGEANKQSEFAKLEKLFLVCRNIFISYSSETPSEAIKQSQFAKLKKLLKLGLFISISYLALPTISFSLFNPKGYIFDLLLFSGFAGYVIHQILGIYIGIKSHRIGFKFGTHGGYIGPLIPFAIWWGVFSWGIDNSDLSEKAAALIATVVAIFVSIFVYRRLLKELKKLSFSDDLIHH